MKRMLILFAVLSGLALVQSSAHCAENLLLNGSLDSTTQVGSPLLYFAEPTSWTITTDPCSYSPCTIIPYTAQGQPYTPFPGYIAGFADRSTPNFDGNMDGAPDFKGFVGAAFEGHFPGEIVGPVDAEIKQKVPGQAGNIYRLAGWAHFEAGYAGGVEFLALNSPNQRNQNAQAANPGVPVASLTDTIFALEFLDNMGMVLPNSIVWELHNDGGQQNDPDSATSRDWVRHILTAQAPAGTVEVQVRAAMINGEFHLDPPGGAQAVYFDDISLNIVPEPTSGLLALLCLVFAGGVRQRTWK